jgi:hypothetical protein
MKGHFGNKDGNSPLLLDVVQPTVGLHTYMWDGQVPIFSTIEVHTVMHQSPRSIHSFKKFHWLQNNWSDTWNKIARGGEVRRISFVLEEHAPEMRLLIDTG